MWNFDKPWHQDPVISPRLRFHMFWPSWGAGSCQTHDSRFLFEVFGTFLADWFRMCFFFRLFIWKYITIKGESKGQIEGRYCSFTASTLSKVPSSPSLSTKCFVSVVFFANMFVVVDVAFSFGTSPKKHINGNPRMLVGFLPVALASAPRPPLFSSLGAKPKECGTSVDDGSYSCS